jgi:S1-C subfamily serine protease
MPPPPWHRQWWLAAGAVAVVTIAFLALDRSSPPAKSVDEDRVEGIVDEAVGKATKELRSSPARSAEVYDAILPSLVVIRTERSGSSDDRSGLGAGFIINDQGAILTSLHVVEGATNVRLSFADGTESAASIQSSDPDNDIAVLTPQHLPEVVVPAVLGGTAGLRIGDEAFAAGHPLGFVGSLTAGVISGLDRSIPFGSNSTLRGLIQFDTAVNPGSSGGPLLDRNGQVIGIVTALANPSEDGSFVGIGFAVPITTAGGAAGAPPR